MVFGVLAAMTVLFTLLVFVKSKLKRQICAICLSVSLTWIGLFIAYHLGWFLNAPLLGLLMGQSITGLYFLLEKRVPKDLLIFRFPLLLSLTYLFYGAMTLEAELWPLLLLSGLWLISLLLYGYKANPRLREMADRMIACCGDW